MKYLCKILWILLVVAFTATSAVVAWGQVAPVGGGSKLIPAPSGGGKAPRLHKDRKLEERATKIKKPRKSKRQTKAKMKIQKPKSQMRKAAKRTRAYIKKQPRISTASVGSTSARLKEKKGRSRPHKPAKEAVEIKLFLHPGGDPLNPGFEKEYDWNQMQEGFRQGGVTFSNAKMVELKEKFETGQYSIQIWYPQKGPVYKADTRVMLMADYKVWTNVAGAFDEPQPARVIRLDDGDEVWFLRICGNPRIPMMGKPPEKSALPKYEREDETGDEFPAISGPHPSTKKFGKRREKFRNYFGAGYYHNAYENRGFYAWYFGIYQPIFHRIAQWDLDLAIGLYLNYSLGGGKDQDFRYWWNEMVTGMIATLYGKNFDADLRAGFGFLSNKGEINEDDFELLQKQLDFIVQLAGHVNWYARGDKTFFPRIEMDVNFRLPVLVSKHEQKINGYKTNAKPAKNQQIRVMFTLWIIQFYKSENYRAYLGLDIGGGKYWWADNFFDVGPALLFSLKGKYGMTDVTKLNPVLLHFEFGKKGVQLEHAGWVYLNGLIEWIKRAQIRRATEAELTLKGDSKTSESDTLGKSKTVTQCISCNDNQGSNDLDSVDWRGEGNNHQQANNVAATYQPGPPIFQERWMGP